ncbi:hypothetical protein FRC01_005725, partial [Tulasnella sp. 417]
HTSLHGLGSYRVPWNYDTGNDMSVSKALAKLIDNKYRLSPLIYAAVRTGLPKLGIYGALIAAFRAQAMEARETQSSPTPHNARMTHRPHHAPPRQQFVLGHSLLVASVFTTDDGDTEYYIPFDWDYNDGSKARVYELSEGACAEAVVPGSKTTEKTVKLRAQRNDYKVTVKVVEGTLKGWSATLFAQGSDGQVSTATAGGDAASFTL